MRSSSGSPRAAATYVPSLKPCPETSPALPDPLAERATHCYIVHYAAADARSSRKTDHADWVRMPSGSYSREETGCGSVWRSGS